MQTVLFGTSMLFMSTKKHVWYGREKIKSVLQVHFVIFINLSTLIPSVVK